MYAVKPKGGNWPTTLGSTLPLKEQGVFGKHLSESQLKEGGDNVLDLFKKQLRNFYPRAVDNRELLNDWEDFSTKYDSDVDYDIKEDLADQFVEKINAKNLSLDPNAKQLKSISDLQKIIPAYNSWIMGNYQKYIRDLMGTGIKFDPMLQEIEKANIPLKDLFGERYSLDDNVWKDIARQRREEARRDYPRDLNIDLQDPLNKNVGLQTAQTEPGKMFEDYIDAAMSLRGQFNYPRSQYPAMTAILDRNKNAKIHDLILDKLSEESGMPFIREKLLQDLISGDLPLEKIARTTPATVLRDVIISYQAQQKSKEAVQKAKDTWRASRFNEIQSDIEYPDGSKMHVITPEDARTNPNLVLRDLGQSTIDLKQCIGAGCRNTPDYPNMFGPYIEPHTGKEARQASPYEDTHVKRYMDRLEQGKAEIARLLDSKGVAQASIDLHFENPRQFTTSQLEGIIDRWLEDNDPQGMIDFENNAANLGTTSAVENALQQYSPHLGIHIDKMRGPQTKFIAEMKGSDNGEILEEYVPHMVSWLNQHANELTDVRDLDKLPGVHDLTRHYDAIGNLMDKNQHWYSPTVEGFFQTMEKENALPRFFTTDEFALKATERGVDLSAEPPKQLSDWEKSSISEELYRTLTKHPDSLYLDNENLRPNILEPVKILLGNNAPEAQLPFDIHAKLIEMILNHRSERDVFLSTLSQLSDRGPYAWVEEFIEPQISNMLNIMADWFKYEPFEKIPTNKDFDEAVKKYPSPFDNVKFYGSDWESAPDNYWKHLAPEINPNALMRAVQQMEPEPEQQLPFDRPEFPGPLGQNMNDYFEGNAYNAPENMIEPYATETRILMGSQRPEARLPIGVHRVIVDALLNQDNRSNIIRRAISGLQMANVVNGIQLTLPQAENALNILIDWTERFPLNE
jgi:hypothetical protein